MPSLQILSYDQILQRMVQRVVARTDLTDLTDSSVLKHVLAAVAREVDAAYFSLTRLTDLFSLDRASGSDLDERALDIQPGTLLRLPALKATGQVVFSRATNTGSTISVPTGTVVKTSDGRSYRTAAAAIIASTSVEQILGHGVGRDSNPVTALAMAAGANGNADVGSANAIGGSVPGVSEVTNVTAFSQGRDRETDDEFRARLKDYVASLVRTTPDALKYATVGLVDPVSTKRVVYANVFEDPVDRGNVIIYIDDGAGSASETANAIAEPVIDPALGGEEFLRTLNYPIDISAIFTVTRERPSGGAGVLLTKGTDYFVNPANGLLYFPNVGAIQAGDAIKVTYTYFTNLIAHVQKVVDGDATDRLNFPGFRPAGVLVRVLAPKIIVPTVQATLTLIAGFEANAVALEARTAVLNYINSLGISGDVIRAEIIEQIMDVDGVYDVVLAQPTENLVVHDDELPRVTLANVLIS